MLLRNVVLDMPLVVQVLQDVLLLDVGLETGERLAELQREGLLLPIRFQLFVIDVNSNDNLIHKLSECYVAHPGDAFLGVGPLLALAAREERSTGFWLQLLENDKPSLVDTVVHRLSEQTNLLLP